MADTSFKHWITIFGWPKKLLSDNGLEFNNTLFRQMTNFLGIELSSGNRTAFHMQLKVLGVMGLQNDTVLLGQIMTKIVGETCC